MAGVDFAGIVLTGGGGARMGGVDKATVELGGRTLLEHALTALATATEVVVVGGAVPTTRPVTYTRETPRGGGPAAGVLAGLEAFAGEPSLVVVLAVDMPRVTADTVHRLVGAARGDGAVLVDHEGRRQHLCAAYTTTALARSRPMSGEGHGMSMQRLVADLDVAEVSAEPGETRDVDTWDDLAALRALTSDSGRKP